MGSLVAHVRHDWRELRRGKPGHRFQERYDESARERADGGWGLRIAKIAGGIVAIAIGLAEMVFPGPAIVFIAIGGAMLATQFRGVAEAMDWLEVQGRALTRFGRGWWRRASTPRRVVVIAVVATGAAAGGYLGYLMLSG